VIHDSNFASIKDRFRGWPVRDRQLCFGADYSPEQWDEQVWADDVELMREAQVNIIAGVLNSV
jgi:beta-galactosidase